MENQIQLRGTGKVIRILKSFSFVAALFAVILFIILRTAGWKQCFSGFHWYGLVDFSVLYFYKILWIVVLINVIAMIVNKRQGGSRSGLALLSFIILPMLAIFFMIMNLLQTSC